MRRDVRRLGRQVIVFTDLDGTLLDASTYSFKTAQAALDLIRELSVPLIICSSKTRAEIEYYRSLLLNSDPFISENGGGIFIPREYMEFAYYLDRTAVEEIDDYLVIRLGVQYRRLREGIETLRAKGFDVKGFGDMTVDEISQTTGLSSEEAAMATEREFDEPFLFSGTRDKRTLLFASIKGMGFNVTQGTFYHLLGDSDKGKAVSILIDIFKKQFHDIYSVALGDSPNDLPMLRSVDMPVIVRKQDGTYDPHITLSNLVKADGIGPEGWNRTILKLLEKSGRKRHFD